MLVSYCLTNTHPMLQVSLIASDVSSLRSGISRMSRSVQSLADPPRFSCGVTGEEVKVSGVVRCVLENHNIIFFYE